MTVPVPPPVNLENLSHLVSLEPIEPEKRSLARVAVPITTGLLGAVGLLAWRILPIALARRRRTSRRNWWIAGGVGVAALALTGWQLQRLFAERPRHEVEMRRGRLEVRRYPAMRIAETTVDTTWDQALNEGFLRLAKFIFGDNDARQQIAMTAPVMGTGDGNGFRVAFVLPEGLTPPVPNDPRVAVREVPPRRVAALRFHGRYDASSIEAHKRELMHELTASGLTPHGEAVFAGYDPPTTLPLLRRNELWVEVEGAPSERVS